MRRKREKGQYFTTGNPFKTTAFQQWAKSCRIENGRILEPFAGCGSIPALMKEAGYRARFIKYDIQPAKSGIHKRDTLRDFPKGHRTVITNPPWLAKNSAKRRGLQFPKTRHDDLYKVALEKCLQNSENVCAIVPDTFVISREFRERLVAYIALPGKMFEDTESPTGMALFNGIRSEAEYWIWDKRIGNIPAIEAAMPKRARRKLRFNATDGNLGLIAIDNHREASIRFCEPAEIPENVVKTTSRSRTRIRVPGNPPPIHQLNRNLNQLREKTSDMPFSSFKGTRQDGLYRRRISWQQAEDIICAAL